MGQKLPPGIRPRGEKWFVDVTVNGKRKTATVATYEEAVAKKEDLTEALRHGKEVKLQRSNAVTWTLQQALDKILSLPKPAGWRGTSYERTGTIFANDAIQFMGAERKLDTISRDLIDAWCHSCEAKGNSDATINRKTSALSKMLKVAIDYGGLKDMPKMPPLRKERVGRIRFITAKEEAALHAWFKAMGQEEMSDAVAVLIDTGMRRGELLNVRPSDVDMDTGVGVIMVYGTEGKGTKNGGFRSVPMTARVRAIMAERLEGNRCFDIAESYIRHAWDAARAHLDLTDDPEFVLHACRHTCATRLVKAGVSLPVVKTWLGHSNIQTTMRYAHFYPQDLMNAAAALERNVA